MNYIDIGGSGLKGSEIGIGCMRINGLSQQELDKYVHGAVELGVNFFDHADIYGGGNCETMFGKVLADDKSLREKILIQSKCAIRRNPMYDFSKEYILSSTDAILQRLQVDYIDALLLHRPDALMEPEEVAEAFNELEKAGKVKNFGVSNFNPMQMELLQSGLKQKLIANQMQFSIMHTGMIDFGICTNTTFPGAVNKDGSILDYCRLKNVTMQAWSPFQFGFFEGVFIDNDKFPELNKVMDEVAEKYSISKTALSVAWILRHPSKMQALVGTTNLDRLTDICTAGNIRLAREDWYKIYLAAGSKLP